MCACMIKLHCGRDIFIFRVSRYVRIILKKAIRVSAICTQGCCSNCIEAKNVWKKLSKQMKSDFHTATKSSWPTLWRLRSSIPFRAGCREGNTSEAKEAFWGTLILLARSGLRHARFWAFPRWGSLTMEKVFQAIISLKNETSHVVDEIRAEGLKTTDSDGC